MRIAIDVDGVVAEFNTDFTRLAKVILGRDFYEPYGESWHLEDVLGLSDEEADKVWAHVNAAGYCQTIPFVDSALESVSWLIENHKVVFVTAPLKASPTWASDRYQWLKKHFPHASVAFTGDKYWVDADLLIEDHVGHAERWLEERQARGGDPFVILYARRHNQQGLPDKYSDRYRRLADWPAIMSFIRTYLPK
jgi:5'(3')-deoxyribonucleotidase